MSRNSGFTLVELMVTLTVAAIFLTIAVPSFLSFMQNAKRDSQVFDFVSALNVARSEAIKRGAAVTLCPTENGTSCKDTTNWEIGWLAYADADGDGSADAGEVVDHHRALDPDTTLRSGSKTVVFQSTGFRLTGAQTFRLCDSRGTADARSITVTQQGSVSTGAGATACP